MHQRRHPQQEFLRFLRTIDASTPTELDLHQICDNYAPQKTAQIQRWLPGPSRVLERPHDRGVQS